MKKIPLLTTLITVLFVLTACGSGSASTNSFNVSNNGGSPRTLNPESKLALGTIKLEGTQQAVDPKMAANLLPLWQLLIQLNSSTSTAPQEVTAVVDQIQTTMKPDQMNTISSMQLTQADISTVFQQQGRANGTGGTTNSGTTRSSGGNRGNGGGQNFVFVGGGGAPGGAFPGGGFSNNGSTGSSTGTQASSAQAAAQAAQARQKATSTLLINQLIKLLETKLSN